MRENTGPTFAVAVPTRNRPGYLASLLESLQRQTRRDFLLVVNDSSDRPIAEDDRIAALLAAFEHRVIRTETGHDRHQRAMEAVPRTIDLIVRVDDDVVLTPTCLERLIGSFGLFPDAPLAAVGACCPEPHLRPRDLDVALCDPRWLPTVDEPTWRLQGHPYRQREILEVESLLGHILAYRRRALEDAGGWAVAGYSRQAHREESDACARLRLAGYTLLVRTDALAWHLYAPAGGSREVRKGPQGNVLISDPAPIEADERLFRRRLTGFRAAGLCPRPLYRYRLADLGKGRHVRRPMRSLRGRVLYLLRAFGAWLAPLTRLRALLARLVPPAG